MQNIFQDLRYAIRMLLKRPRFTVVAVAVLALGIGANTSIFSVINAVLLRPLPYSDPEQIMLVTETDTVGEKVWAAPADYIDWTQQSEAFESLAAMRWWSANLTGGNEVERIQGALVTPNAFNLLGVQPALGRWFLPEEGQSGNGNVVILSHALWQRRFGRDPGVIGTTASFNGISRTVIGVMPPAFKLPLLNIRQSPIQTEAWAPLDMSTNYWQARGAHQLRVLARLKPGVTMKQAQAEMSAIAGRLEQLYPNSNTRVGAAVTSFHESLVGNIRPALLVLSFAVGFLLLIACANVANLLLARAAERQKEIAIRTALGASRSRMIQQLLSECVLMALIGGALGLLLALWGTDTLVALSPQNVPQLQEVSIDRNVLGFSLLLSLLTGIVFGLAPAWQSSRPDLNSTLKEGANLGLSFRRQRARSLLVIGEIALSLVLLIGAGLMIKSFLRIQEVEPGFNRQNVLTMQVSLPFSKYPEQRDQAAFYQQVIERIRSLPGVEAAGASTTIPLTGSTNSSVFYKEGEPQRMMPEEISVITPDYFRATGIAVLKGRDFSERDDAEAPQVIIVSRSMADRYWPEGDALGKRVKLEGPDEQWRSIVGVVDDVKQERLESESIRQYYLPYSQDPWYLSSTMSLIVRSRFDPTGLFAAVRNEVSAVDKDIPLYNISSLEEIYSLSLAGRRFNTLLLGIFAAVALVLASLGVYGLISYSVTQRTREIGIRLALGAQAKDVVRLVVGQGMLLVLIGVTAGLAAAFALTRLMESLLFGVSATDLSAFAAISLLLIAVALAACYLPARRAIKIDPMTALRYE